MRLIYDLAFLVFSLFYLPYFFIKGKGHRDIFQRFGFVKGDLTADAPVWIHAVSVGEAAVAAKIAARIKKESPTIPVFVSTTTCTGNEMIQKIGKGVVDAVFYYPVDISFVVSKVVRLVNPRVYVIIETELWPNLLLSLKAKGVPVVLVNGRISDSSFANYKKIKFITKRMLSCINCFCMQSERDSERIQELGAASGNVFITGNVKFDEELPKEGTSIEKRDLGFSEDDQIIVAGSTHFPEETAVIDIYRQLKEGRDKLKLVLAPRHVERVDAIRVYLEKTGLKYLQLSEVLDSARLMKRVDEGIRTPDSWNHNPVL